tara:strand:+ start:711 stop:860 length:150 start_codon:yes stop_codon:yes gene_type:complete
MFLASDGETREVKMTGFVMRVTQLIYYEKWRVTNGGGNEALAEKKEAQL